MPKYFRNQGKRGQWGRNRPFEQGPPPKRRRDDGSGYNDWGGDYGNGWQNRGGYNNGGPPRGYNGGPPRGFNNGGPPRGFNRGTRHGQQLAEQVFGWMQWIQGDQATPTSQSLFPKSQWDDYNPAEDDIPGRLGNFAKYLTECYDDDEIQLIDDNLRDGWWQLVTEYKQEPLYKIKNRFILTASLYISGVFIARTVGGDKRIKRACYRRALQVLRSKTIKQIVGQKDVGADLLRKDLESFFKPDKHYDDPFDIAQKRFIKIVRGEIQADENCGKPAAPLTDDEMKTRLANVTMGLKTTKRRARDNLLYFLDTVAFKFQLPTTCVIKILESDPASTNPAEEIVCDVFFDRLLVSRGRGNSRRTSHAQAYDDAFNALSNLSPEEILAKSKEIEQEDLKVKMIEVWHKNRHYNSESNIGRLKVQRLDPLEIDKTWDEVVIVEGHDHANDRRRNAFSILCMTATWNAMMLEWSFHEENDMYRCIFTLQQHKIGEGVSRDQGEAKHLASMDALFKLYETRPCIQVASVTTTPVRSFKDIQDRALQLKTELGETGNNDIIVTIPEGGIVIYNEHEDEDDNDDQDDGKKAARNKEAPVPFCGPVWPMPPQIPPPPSSGIWDPATKRALSTPWDQPAPTVEGDASKIPMPLLPEAVPADNTAADATPSGGIESKADGQEANPPEPTADSTDDKSKEDPLNPKSITLQEFTDNYPNVPLKYRVNKWRKMVIEDEIEKHVATGTLEDLMYRFGQGLQDSGDLDQIKINAAKYGLRTKKERFGGEMYYKIYKKLTPQEVLAALEKLGPVSGRYSLVPRDELPKYQTPQIGVKGIAFVKSSDGAQPSEVPPSAVQPFAVQPSAVQPAVAVQPSAVQPPADAQPPPTSAQMAMYSIPMPPDA